MCGRYTAVTVAEKLEKHFRASFENRDLFTPSPNISVGDLAPVITNDKQHTIQLFQFGLTPFWAKKRMYLFNARTEGDYNKDDSPGYSGMKGIILKPAFRKPIRDNRCLVLCDGFIEGSKEQGLSKPYIIFSKKRTPIALAGIYDEWLDKSSGEIVKSFSIITTVANELLHRIGHHRMPVILHKNDYFDWLNQKHLASATRLLQPYNDYELGAYPISPKIKDPRNKSIDLIKPVGNLLQVLPPPIVIPPPNKSRKHKDADYDKNDTIEGRLKN